jgi:hypothetical protein
MRFPVDLLPAVVAASLLANCTQTEAKDPARAMVEDTTRAGSGCGPEGARHLSTMAASYTTLQRGYSGFVVLLQAPGDRVRVVGGPPDPREERAKLPGETEEHAVILMMRRDDPDFDTATDAREALGPQWSSIIGRAFPTMCGKA